MDARDGRTQIVSHRLFDVAHGDDQVPFGDGSDEAELLVHPLDTVGYEGDAHPLCHAGQRLAEESTHVP